MTIRKVPADFATIQAAVDASAAGDSIVVAPGYAGNETVSVTVDELVFSAPQGVAGIVLVASSEIVRIAVADGAPFRIVGNAEGNTLVGNDGANALEGAAGNDVLEGGAGNDVLEGGAGADVLDGGLSGSLDAGDLHAGFGKYYRFVDGPVTFAEAQSLAHGMAVDGVAGRLVTLHSAPENGFVSNTVAAGRTFWMGASDAATEGAWFWQEGTPGGRQFWSGGPSGSAVGGAFANWSPDNPNDDWSGEGQDAGVGNWAEVETANPTWDDQHVAALNAFVVEWDKAAVGPPDADTASYRSSTGGVAVDLSTGGASGGDAEGDTLRSIENLVGSAFDDTLTGDAGDNVLAGLAGNDVMNGLAGNDVMDGGDGIDTISYAGAAAGVRVKLATVGRAQRTSGAGIDKLSGFENLTGSAFNDSLTGDAGDNVLLGGDGSDQLIGGAGTDTMDGGEGGDTYTIDNDIVHDTGTTGMDTAIVNRSTTLAADSGIETLKGKVGSTGSLILTGNELDNRIIGNDGNNLLRGLAAADSLYGGLGNDRLEGGTGRDMLSGDAGRDTFIFKAGDSLPTATTFDVVADFVSGVDTVDLDTIGGGGLPLAAYAETTTAGNTFNAARTAATAAMAGGTVSVVFVAGATDGWLFWNTDGNLTTAEQAVRLNGLGDVGAFAQGDLI